MKAFNTVALLTIIVVLTNCGNNKTAEEKSFEDLFPIQRIHQDSTVKVAQEEFVYLIQKGTSIVTTKKMEELTPEDHILVIMLINTKPVYFKKKGYKAVTSAYKELEENLKNMRYAKQVSKLLEWKPNGGDGIHFPTLNINMGTTRRFDWGLFEIKG